MLIHWHWVCYIAEDKYHWLPSLQSLSHSHMLC
uniref:Uncharacterized protein n=1 Tax=Rhizophora mucronata TaxID=61149 RepID=A0A2P2QVA3_RHIMU